MWFWLRWAKEIESDLLAHRNLDIGLWHRLTINPDTGAPYLDSRRLLILLEFLPEEGAFKTATRGGRWPDWKQMLAEVYNEQLRMRSSYHAAHSTKDNDVRFDPKDFYFMDPAQRELQAAAAKRAGEDLQQLVADFNAELGFS